MTLRLDAGAAAAISAKHERAATTIDDSAGSMPPSVDGGLATAYLARLMAAVASTAGELAILNQAVASQVRDVADALGQTEAAIADEFVSINGGLG